MLWSGLPIITLPLKTLASRVAAGLCQALECPELIASSPEDYEEKAVRLAVGQVEPKLELELPGHLTDRLGSTELKTLRFKIEKKRTTAPLFNTKLWVKNFEKALKTAVELENEGIGPKHIEVVSDNN